MIEINMYLLCAISDAEIIMTLWEDYVLQLDDAIEKNHFVREPLVLMLTLAKIKDAKGDCNVYFFFLHFCFNLIYDCMLHVTIIFFADKYPLSVQNIKNGSKLYVNADIAEIKKFRNRYDNCKQESYIFSLLNSNFMTFFNAVYVCHFMLVE